ncbi:MAG: hypothetical protein WC976_06020 [Caldisericia bacterium]
MQVAIRYLKQGLIKVEVPENFKQMSAQEKLDWAGRELDKLPLEDIKEGLVDDITTIASAIEIAEGEHIGNPIVSTKEWDVYMDIDVASAITTVDK